MSASNVRYTDQMESSYDEEGSWTADETAGSHTGFYQPEFDAPSFQTSIMIDPGKAANPQPQPFCQPQPKKQPAQPQVLYCEICRVGCAGPQPYADHLNGQKHNKKQNANSAANRLCCQLCDVTCGSADAFAAHVRGAKHLRVLNLHTMMGKTVPTVTMPSTTPASTPTSTPSSASTASIPSFASASPAPVAALVLTAGKNSETERINVAPTAVASDAAAAEEVGSSETAADARDIVGEEFVEELRNEEGLLVSYNCKLCECVFYNRMPNSKRIHLRGRRHQLQYKENVDPTVEVYVGPRHITVDDRYVIDKHMDLYPPKEEMTEIHNAISAFENALKLVFDLIAAENALSKKVNLVQTSEPTVQSVEAEKMAEKMATDELCLDAEEEMMETTATEAAHFEAARPIKGAMRVGLLSKGLLLRGDLLAEHFVVICSERPTRSLIQKIFDHLPAQLEIVSPSKKFNVETRFEEAGLFVTIEEPAVSFAVTLTSMLIVEDQEQVDPHPSAPSDQLSPGHCLSALALMRRTKWFQMRPWEMKSGTVVAHVLRDFCRRNGIWRPLSEWALVLLVKMGIFAAGIDIGPGEALRSFFECISSGILLPGGYGLMDPCEMVPTDVTAYLTEQQCEEITASAQQCLRPLVYRQLYKILDIAQFSGSGFKRLRDPEDEPEREDDKKLKQEDPEDEPEREDDRKQEDPEDKPEREDDRDFPFGQSISDTLELNNHTLKH